MDALLSTPVRQAKLGIASTKSLPLANEYKKLLNEQHLRLWTKHQQDLDLIDDIRSYVKARLSIEKEYTSALCKLGKQHSSYVAKKFTLLNQCDPTKPTEEPNKNEHIQQLALNESDASDSRLQKRLANNGLDEPDKPCSLYKVWSEHINRLQTTAKNRADQFEQLIMVVDKLKDIRSHKSTIGKRCLDTHLKRIHEDVVVSMVDVDKARKLYYEDESQAKKARENEEKIKKKRSGLLTKFTDLQAKKERTSAQREANDIQSTQARNDYIMALAAANAHLEHYYQRDLTDFIHLIDDGVLDHCKIFMATLSECDINSLKDTLTNAQYWSKMINLTGSLRTNSIFLECEQSSSLRDKISLQFEPCNDDPIQTISLEHNADYALQHEIDKWFTWFKKECRNLSQLMHQLEICQRAFAEGKKSIELNGQITDDLEPKIIELKQQIRKSEAAKLKAQARLKVIKEGGMQIEEWSAVESEIRADMMRAQEESEVKMAKELVRDDTNDINRRRDLSNRGGDPKSGPAGGYMFDSQVDQVHLQVSKESDDSEAGESIHNLASVSPSASTLVQKQQNALSGYSALADPSLAWQDDYSNAWGGAQTSGYNMVVSDSYSANNNNSNRTTLADNSKPAQTDSNRYDLLGASTKQHNQQLSQQAQITSTTVQSSSPLSAIVDGAQSPTSPYQGMMGDTYKSDYECDYNRMNHPMRSAASSVEPYNQYLQQSRTTDPFGKPLHENVDSEAVLNESSTNPERNVGFDDDNTIESSATTNAMLHKKVIALYTFDRTNEEDLAFNEGDVLFVTDINDANWVKAVKETTGEEGYIPTSYVTLMDEGLQGGASNENQKSTDDGRNSTAVIDETDDWLNQDAQESGPIRGEKSSCYCRALYDHEPEAGTCEDDGLPHLALVQGELMRILDQGEDDGWWLVEKEETGLRGYVPSMLVEEFDPDGSREEDEDDGEASEQEKLTDYSDNDDSVKAMPSFKPPVLQESMDAETFDSKGPADLNNNSSANNQEVKTGSSSLIPTSFIIIEPTPEVESRRIEDDLKAAANQSQDLAGYTGGPEDSQQVIQRTSSKPPSDVSYSVVNEDFVLEKPTRKPHQQGSVVPHHETPTILEENLAEEVSEVQNNDLSSKTPDGNYEPLSEVDSIDMPAPPCVVVEIYDDGQQVRSPSLDGGSEDGRGDLSDLDGDQPPAYVQKEIKHSGNVDVNPLLRHRAEEFSKQIIAEAIMMAEGSEVGPSTSGMSSNKYI